MLKAYKCSECEDGRPCFVVMAADRCPLKFALCVFNVTPYLDDSVWVSVPLSDVLKEEVYNDNSSL